MSGRPSQQQEWQNVRERTRFLVSRKSLSDRAGSLNDLLVGPLVE
jgi:hypothetical protein